MTKTEIGEKTCNAIKFSYEQMAVVGHTFTQKLKKGKLRTEEGGVVISEQCSAPIKKQGVFPNIYTPSHPL